jgi:hypothetical protein
MPRQSPVSGLAPTTLMALFAGLIGLFAVHKTPLQDTRPAVRPIPINRPDPTTLQDIEARLWEDPLAAVARARAAEAAPGSDARHQASALNSSLADLVKAAPAPLLVLGVLMSGAPYTEDNENRRRARYAVLAGLHRSGFEPADAEHLGYFVDNSLDARGATPATSPMVVAHEWLSAEQATEAVTRADRVLLLWLNQDEFRLKPLAHFAALVQSVAGGIDHVAAALIGPSDSDGLREMTDELKSCATQENCPTGVDAQHRIAIYSPTATAADDWVLGSGSTACALDPAQPADKRQLLAGTFKLYSKHNVHLFRTVANDCVVSRHLYEELQIRGIKSLSQITIVAERDSLYARLMGQYFGGCYTSASAGLSDATSTSADLHPTCFTYLRGLDGLTPPEPAHSGATPSTTDSSTSAYPKTTSTGAPQSSSGAKQLDYLLRLSASIAAGAREGHCNGPGRVDSGKAENCTRAIGILGSDLYDKVLVLQALHRALPRAVFFTTDLDARLLDPQHLKWTRHLLVGSGYGLVVRPELQADIPPFRDTYQTSIFLATILAADQEFSSAVQTARNQGMDRSPLELVGHWSSRPRVFEIGRTAAFDLHEKRRLGPCPTILECRDVSPVPAGAYWSDPAPSTGLKLSLGVIAVLLTAAFIALGPHPNRQPQRLASPPEGKGRPERTWMTVCMIGIAGLVLTTLLWPSIARLGAGDEVPIPIFSGASIWAGLMVEFLATLAVICLGIRGQRELDQDAVCIGEQFDLMPPDALLQYRTAQMARLGWRCQLKELIWLPIQRKSTTEDPPDAGSPSALERLLARYLYRGRARARITRVSIVTLLSVMALIPIDRIAGTSYIEAGVLWPTGPEARIAALVSLMGLLSIQFLVFWVADAMLLSRAFALELLREWPEWPTDVSQRKETELGLSSDPAVIWLNLQLVAARTACVVTLVWYPSLVIAGMAIAAFTVEFGPFSFASNPVSLIISTLILVAAALLLRASAESLKGSALTRLENYRIRALTPRDPKSTEASQLDHLIARVDALGKGAFAPYSQQPLIKAILLPAATYGANLLLQYLNSAGL